MNHRLLAALLAGASLLATAAEAQAPRPAATPAARAATVPPLNFKMRTLPNGMRVFHAVDRNTANVTVQVWYGVGAKDDPQGRSGFAHLFEHLMFKETKNMPDEFMNRLVEDVGGEINAFTADDMTAYYQVIPANHLERLLWAEADRLGSLQVGQETFTAERDVVKEEFRTRVLAPPYGRLQRLLIPDASFTVHPYKRPGIGSIEDLDAATLDDVRSFHRTYYRPDNANLLVIGNFDERRLNAWVDKYFGPIKRPSAPLPRVRAVEPPRTGTKTVTGYGPNVPLPAVAITYQAPAASHPDAPALTVMDAILSGGRSSRLYRSLVYEKQLAQAAFTAADLRQQPGLIWAYAVLASGQTPEAGEAALRAELARLREEPVSAAELAEAKNELIYGAVSGRETVDGRAFALGQALIVQGDPRRVNTEVAELNAVTAADVQRVARKYLVDDRRVVVRYLPESQRPAGQAVATPPPGARPSPPVAASTPAQGVTPPAGPAGGVPTRASPPPVAAPVQAQLPRAVERTLPNGLRVIVAPKPTLPVVTAYLMARSGGSSDPAGLPGVASFTGGLLTQGTTTRSATEIATAVEALGGSLNAGTSYDASYVFLDVLSPNLPQGLAILSDVARNPAFAQAEVDRLRKQRLDNLRVSLNQPASIAGLVAPAAVFGGTLYGRPAGGTPESLPRITREDVQRFHAAAFRPDNAVLVLAGDVTPERGFELAQQLLGDWARPAAPLPPQTATAAPAGTGAPRVVVVDLPGAGQSSVSVLRRTIPYRDQGRYAAEVANTVLGGGYSARLNQEVRIKRGLSYGAGSGVDLRRDAGLFRASAQTANETADEVVDLLLAEMGRLGTEPVAMEELTPRRTVLTGGRARSLEQNQGVASELAELALFGAPLSELQSYAGSLERVTPAELGAFAQSALRPQDATILVVGDSKAFLEPLRAKHPNVEVVPVAELDLSSPTLRRARSGG